MIVDGIIDLPIGNISKLQLDIDMKHHLNMKNWLALLHKMKFSTPWLKNAVFKILTLQLKFFNYMYNLNLAILEVD